MNDLTARYVTILVDSKSVRYKNRKSDSALNDMGVLTCCTVLDKRCFV